ncbi:hypothetical protein AB0F68_28365 [Micromonospora sp. NPDC023966]|uniref:hypothetical protein n=1 Tax=Micromonospora sp. NPDC023966 TaxID=3154699 RepID=UPI003402B524
MTASPPAATPQPHRVGRCRSAEPTSTASASEAIGDTAVRLAKHDVHVAIAYQRPAGTGVPVAGAFYLVLAGLLAGFGFWRLQRRPS